MSTLGPSKDDIESGEVPDAVATIKEDEMVSEEDEAVSEGAAFCVELLRLMSLLKLLGCNDPQEAVVPVQYDIAILPPSRASRCRTPVRPTRPSPKRGLPNNAEAGAKLGEVVGFSIGLRSMDLVPPSMPLLLPLAALETKLMLRVLLLLVLLLELLVLLLLVLLLLVLPKAVVGEVTGLTPAPEATSCLRSSS